MFFLRSPPGPLLFSEARDVNQCNGRCFHFEFILKIHPNTKPLAVYRADAEVLPESKYDLPAPTRVFLVRRNLFNFSKNWPLADSFIESRCQFIYIFVSRPLFM